MPEENKRLLVTGSRDWDDADTIMQELTTAWINLGMGEVTLVSGNCPTGADKIAEDYWRRSKFGPVEKHPADWEKHGKRAGFIRNSEMAKLGADLCVAFVKDNSKGTVMMAKLAEKAGITVMRAVMTS
jgi:hypothetical protein